jgi:hypothetical protein
VPGHKEATSIAMAGEIVFVDVTKDTVRVSGTYWLKNTGNVQEVLPVRFPAQQGPNADSPAASNFKAAVDGMLLQVTAGKDDQNGLWYGWTMVVGPGQTRVLSVEYDCDTRTSAPQGESGEADADAREFAYRLDTGAGWAGPIGIARIIVRLNDESARRIESLEPANPFRAGDTIVWQFSQFEPTQRHNIRVRFGSGQEGGPGTDEQEPPATPGDAPSGDTDAQ